MNAFRGRVGMSGALSAKVNKPPGPGLMYKVRNFPNVWPGLWKAAVAKALGMNHLQGRLYARLFRADGRVVDYGLISTKLVTTAFVNFMVDELQAETSEWGDFKWHDSGVGVTGANITDVDIETTDGESRSSGTQAENAANIYESVGTIAYTTTKAITEHGLFSQAAGTTLLDRHTFGALNVVNGDSITFTYRLTCSAGG